jgi:hypothetical protein
MRYSRKTLVLWSGSGIDSGWWKFRKNYFTSLNVNPYIFSMVRKPPCVKMECCVIFTCCVKIDIIYAATNLMPKTHLVYMELLCRDCLYLGSVSSWFSLPFSSGTHLGTRGVRLHFGSNTSFLTVFCSCGPKLTFGVWSLLQRTQVHHFLYLIGFALPQG